MGSAYTPGLKVSARTTVEKARRLPLKGVVLVAEGDAVQPDTVVARTFLPGLMQTARIAEKLGIDAADVPGLLQVKIGDAVTTGDVLAETKGVFGKYFRTRFVSPVTGHIELISSTTGHVGIREAPEPVERTAYIRGTVSRVLPEEGVVVSTYGALVQGIFGVGGERLGEIAMASSDPQQPLTPELLTSAHRGKIVVAGAQITGSALARAAELGVVGLVGGGIIDRELMDYLALALNQPGYDIGVAITGQEPIAFTLMVTEGFGAIEMAARTFALFQSLEGKTASINGATQIRAGVIRPEVIVPLDVPPPSSASTNENDTSGQLSVGTSIRIIREPYFGLLATVTALPSELVQVESETLVRVLHAQLADGSHVTVPRANVEIIEGA